MDFALILPLLLVILFGMLDFGRAIYAYNTINNAARQGARVAIVDQNLARIEDTARDHAVALVVTVTVDFRHTLPNTDPTLNPVCTPLEQDCIAMVTVANTFEPVTPIIGVIVGDISLSGRTEMPVERVYASP
ncbi:MAG: TadE family protein [Chloroflexota bacterium]